MLFKRFIIILLLWFGSSVAQGEPSSKINNQTNGVNNFVTDVFIFDSSPAGIIAAIVAANEGCRVVMLTEDKHVGGMRTSGLSMPNLTVRETFGGLGREFHDRIFQYYVNKYGEGSEQVTDCDSGFRFEPHVGEKIFLDWLFEAGVKILNEEYITSVQKEGAKIVSVQTDHNRKISASVFIDASYEGDLMAMAGVSYRVGRESRDEYDESLAGMTYPPSKEGMADDKTQRYCYRVVLTDVPENKVDIKKPENYHRASYMIDAAKFGNNPPSSIGTVLPINMIPNGKTDIRIGEGWLGGSFAFPEATPEERKYIEKEYRDYAEGYLWFLLTDSSVPKEIQQKVKIWGYAKDEFIDNEYWPYHIYVREARRLVGDYVMTEHDILENKFKPDGVAIGSYMLDVHPVQYIPMQSEGLYSNYSFEGMVREGGIAKKISPYEIPFRVLLPKREDAENLLVPVCVSASHIAYSSIRMEPVYMMLGHAAGLAAAMSLHKNENVHDLPTQELRTLMLKQKAVLYAKQFQK